MVLGLIEKDLIQLVMKLDRNVIIFGVDMSSSPHIGNKKKDILIFGKGLTQGLEHTLTAEKLYSVNVNEENRKFCLSLHYDGANSYLFVNDTEIIKFKGKDSEITAYPLCLGNISKDWSVDNMKNTGLKGNVYDFSDDYDAVMVSDILDIHKCLMKNNEKFRICEVNISFNIDAFGLEFIEDKSIRMCFNEQPRTQSKT